MNKKFAPMQLLQLGSRDV